MTLTADPAPAVKAKPKRRRPTGTSLGAPAGPRRVAIYLRRSTDDEHQPFSITAQDRLCVVPAGLGARLDLHR